VGAGRHSLTTYHFVTEWHFRAPLDSLEVREAEEYRHILLRSTGDLVGTGRWEFSETEPGSTKDLYFWDVATTNPILNLVAPLAKRELARNHEQVMANGFAALRPHVEG
jgi:hypothetical protein